MTEKPARDVAVPKERMKTMQAEYTTDIAMLSKQNAERENRLLLWMIGTVVGTIGFGVAVLGSMSRLS